MISANITDIVYTKTQKIQHIQKYCGAINGVKSSDQYLHGVGSLRKSAMDEITLQLTKIERSIQQLRAYYEITEEELYQIDPIVKNLLLKKFSY